MELSEIMLRAFAEAVPQKTKSETEFLMSIEGQDERREFFLCLIYRMPLEDLQRLKTQGKKPEEIQRERNAYLVKTASNMDPQRERVEKGIEKIDELINETRRTTDVLKQEVADAIERERASLQNRIADLKEQKQRDQVLADEYREKIKAYEEKIETLQAEIRSKPVSAVVQPVSDGQSASQQTTLQNDQTDSRQKAQQNDYLQKRAETIKESYSSASQPAGFFEKHRMRKQWEKFDQEIDEFLKEMGSKEDLTAAQKDYLISALEEGYSVQLARKVMVPQLSVEQMQKFIKIYEKRMGGKRR